MENLKKGVPFICAFDISYNNGRLEGYASQQFQRNNFQYVVFISNLIPFKIEKQIGEDGRSTWIPSTTLFKEQAVIAKLVGEQIDKSLEAER